MKSVVLVSSLILLGCGQVEPSPVAVVVKKPWCGDLGMRRDVTPYCLPVCVPDNQVRFVCTYNLGRLAFAKPGMDYAYNEEPGDVHCARQPVKIWQLTPRAVQPGPDDGGISTDVSDSSDCSQGSYFQNDVLSQVISQGLLFYDVSPLGRNPTL